MSRYVRRPRLTFSKDPRYRQRLELYRAVVGRRVRLLVPLQTKGGEKFAAGEVMCCQSTYRGRFTLADLKNADKSYDPSRRWISQVSRVQFEIVP